MALVEVCVLRCLLLAVFLAGAAASAAGQSAAGWAIFSPVAARGLSSFAGSEPGKIVVRAADRVVDGTPNAMAKVHTQGVLPGQGIRDESIAAERDWDAMLSLALAFRLTGDKKYAAAADRYLGAWVAVYKASLDPIDETNIDKWMMAYDLTRGSLSAKTEKDSTVLWQAMAEGYIGWMEKNGHKDIANWSSHRVKLGVMAAYELGDAKLEARGLAVWREHLAENMRTDGSVVDFYKRDALHYVVYDLEPLEMAALTMKLHRVEVFHEGQDGKTLAHAVDWVVPYALGEETHEEFVHSTVPFDAARDKAGEKGYSGKWDAANGLNTLALATMLDAGYAKPLAECAKTTGHRPWIWTQLMALPPVAH